MLMGTYVAGIDDPTYVVAQEQLSVAVVATWPLRQLYNHAGNSSCNCISKTGQHALLERNTHDVRAITSAGVP
jgi:hypothetical protein